MNAKVISAAIGFTLMVVSRSPVTVTVGHVPLHIPVALIFAAAVFLACAALAVVVIRALHRAVSCPHMRTREQQQQLTGA